MAGFSVGGLATGLDTKTMISQLVSVERSAQIGSKRRKAEADQRAQAMNDLINLMKEVQTAAEKVDTINEAAAVTATSGDEDIFKVVGDGTASQGSYDVMVTTLAVAQKNMLSLGSSLTDEISRGTYSISVEGEDKVDVEIDGDNNTLAGLVTAINTSDAEVTATTIYDGENYTLMLTANETGKTVSYSAGDGGSWDGLGINGNKLSSYQPAVDAEVFIDGVRVTSDSNEITTAMGGLTITLTGTSTVNDDFSMDPTKLTVAADSSKTAENVEVLTSAINKVLGNLNTNMKSSENSAGILAFDSTARMLKGAISDALVRPRNGATGKYTSLTLVGIGVDRYGALTFDKDEFAAALADDKDAVMDLITDSSDGMAARFKSMTDDYTLTEGFLTIRKSMYSSRSTDLSDTISRMEDRVLAYEKRLKHQFAQLEQMVSGLNQQSGALARLK